MVHLFFLVSTGKKTIVSDSYESLWEHMHQKHPQELCAFDGLLDILSTIRVVFHEISYRLIRHTDNPFVTDSNAMSVAAKVLNHRIRSVECLFRVNNPWLTIKGIQ